MERPLIRAYEAPAIVETFDALDVLGAAEGFEVYGIGNGSQVALISISR